MSSESQEVILKGIAAAPGIAIGPAYRYSKVAPTVEKRALQAEDVELELERLHTAVARSEKELQKIHSFAEQKLGADNARIFEAQIMILSDRILMSAVERRVAEERTNAEYIVSDEISRYKRMMLAAQDEYMHERAHDLDDVMNRIIRNIQDQRLSSRLEGESVIVSETLTPADTVIFSRNQVLGYATDLGGITSHAAILSRSLKIPAVVGLRTASKLVMPGDPVAVDGYSGELIIRPTDGTLQSLRAKAMRFREFEARLAEIVPLTAETPDHRLIELSANIDFVEEVPFARQQGAAGIGLFRTEGHILGRGSYPSEQEEFEAYDAVAAAIYPQTVIFRTFDVGGDKLAPDAQQEANPFLGWRGIRVMLDRPVLFLTQLRALLRASTRRNVRIMFPMISTVNEVLRARALVEQAKQELAANGSPFDPAIRIGVMIEVPAAAVGADLIAAEVDFLSIGTNDLIQYTMAVDRDNSAVSSLYQPFHPSVLRMIRTVIDAGHARNVWVGMCGEMAGDPVATVLLTGLGLDELSVVPSVLPEIKKIIRSFPLQEAKKAAEHALTLRSHEQIRAFLLSVVRTAVPDIPIES
jgi:phosphotransferase system enzyme I (PtsI)